MTDKILEVRGLTKTYGGEKKPGAKQPTPTLDVLKGIDIDIYRGDVVCLIGPSGCGKSTFLRCLNRLEIPTSGSVKFEGTEVDEAHIDAVRQKMGMVFQHFNLFPHLTVKKNLELAPSLLKLKDKEAISQRADEGSCMTIAIFLPRMVIHSSSVLYLEISTPLYVILPPVMVPLASSIPIKDFVNTDLPEPDSPTIARVSPSYRSREHFLIAINLRPRTLNWISTSLADKIGSFAIMLSSCSFCYL